MKGKARWAGGTAVALLAAGIAVSVTAPAALCAEVPAPEAVGEAEEAAAPTEGGDSAVKAHAGRIGRNFVALTGRHWKGAGAFALRIVLWSVMMALVFFLAGGIAGYILYRVLRRWKLLDAEFRWYRYVRWLWPVLFVTSMAAGSAYGGGWVGVGRVVKKQIREEHLVEKVAVNLLVAFCLDSIESELDGTEDIAELEAALCQSSDLGDMMKGDLEDLMVTTIEEEGELGFVERVVARRAVREIIESDLKEKLGGLNPGILVIFFAEGENLEKYGKKYPKANLALAALSDCCKRVREAVCGAVSGMVLGNLAAGLLVGAGVPLAAMALWLLATWAYRRCARPAGPGASAGGAGPNGVGDDSAAAPPAEPPGGPEASPPAGPPE